MSSFRWRDAVASRYRCAMTASMSPVSRSTRVDQPSLLTPPLPSRSEMERAFLGSDATYDGIFFTAVRTTGIFCRPSCRARKPLPTNVEFFGSIREALFAGYRPCRRCQPATPPGTTPDWAKRLIAAIEEEPDRRLRDADLPKFGVDPARARRYFVEHYGMTFQAYCRG